MRSDRPSAGCRLVGGLALAAMVSTLAMEPALAASRTQGPQEGGPQDAPPTVPRSQPAVEFEVDPRPAPDAAPELRAGEESEALPSTGAVVEIRLLIAGAGRPDWAPRGDLIAYDRSADNGLRAVYTARPDGSGERCATCGLPELRGLHAGNPVWHPSGRWIVFQAERPLPGDDGPTPFLAIPGRNRGDDLWAVEPENRRIWRLTDLSARGGRAHAARFDAEGEKLAWSERVASAGDTWGTWVMRVAAFTERRGQPALKSVRTHEPAKPKAAFYELYGFTADGSGLLFAANLEPGQPLEGLDLYILGLENGETRRLTDSLGIWDRFARLAPNGRILAWASGQGQRPPRSLERRDVSADTPLDLWQLSVESGFARRLTRFNDPFAEEYAGPVMVGPGAWSPEGDRLVVHVAPLAEPRASSLYLVRLASPVGR